MSAVELQLDGGHASAPRAGRGGQGCSVPHDGSAEQQHGSILLAEAIEVLQVDMRGGMHVDAVRRQVAETEVEVEA